VSEYKLTIAVDRAEIAIEESGGALNYPKLIMVINDEGTGYDSHISIEENDITGAFACLSKEEAKKLANFILFALDEIE
jgi:hypothetical protein